MVGIFQFAPFIDFFEVLKRQFLLSNNVKIGSHNLNAILIIFSRSNLWYASTVRLGLAFNWGSIKSNPWDFKLKLINFCSRDSDSPNLSKWSSQESRCNLQSTSRLRWVFHPELPSTSFRSLRTAPRHGDHRRIVHQLLESIPLRHNAEPLYRHNHHWGHSLQYSTEKELTRLSLHFNFIQRCTVILCDFAKIHVRLLEISPMALANYSDDRTREFRRVSNFARAFTLPCNNVKVKHLRKWVSSLHNFILTQVSICRIVLKEMYLALRLSSFNPVTRVFSFVPQDQSTAATTRGVKLHLACQFAKEKGIIGKTTQHKYNCRGMGIVAW